MPRSAPPPLDATRLDELAMRYVARFATTRAKLARYLARKLRERGWAGEGAPDPVAVAARFAERGWVDDAAYAEQKSGQLGRRGYGARRVALALGEAGIAAELREGVVAGAAEDAFATAVTYARRRRLGPFGAGTGDPAVRRRQLAAMARAGHRFDLALRIVDAGSVADLEEPA